MCLFSSSPPFAGTCCSPSFRVGGAFRPPVSTITCGSSLVIFPVMDRRHGSDAWQHPCARTVRQIHAKSLRRFGWPDNCAFTPISPHVRPFFVTHSSHCGVRTLTNTTQPLYPSSWYAGKRKGRVRLPNWRPMQTDIGLNKACSPSTAGSIGGQTSSSVKLYCTSNTQSVFVSHLNTRGWINSTYSHHKYDHEPWLTCVNRACEFAVVHRPSRLDIQAPLSCLSWSRSRLPENTTPIKQIRPASFPGVIQHLPMAAEVQPSLSEFIVAYYFLFFTMSYTRPLT